MRYGIFSDVHSNLEALNVIIEAYQREDIGRYLCIGDIVGYASNPLECIQAVKSLNAVIVAGNHDWGSSGRLDLAYFTPIAKEALLWTQEILTTTEIGFLESLPLVAQEENFVLVHGTLANPQEFYYLNGHEEAFETFAALKKQICFVGHTHRPGVFVELEDNLFYKALGTLQLEEDKRYIINVGSVGQPRDGDPRAAYVIYDTEKKTIELKRIAYDFTITQNKIINAGLPEFLAGRLAQGG